MSAHLYNPVVFNPEVIIHSTLVIIVIDGYFLFLFISWPECLMFFPKILK